MKFFRNSLLILIFSFLVGSCHNDKSSRWDVDLPATKETVKIVDISKDFYNPNFDLQKFKQEYPFFQGSVPDKDFEIRRRDTAEIKIYKTAIAKIDQKTLEKNLSNLFAHIHYYFPEFKYPKVFLYSSALDGIMDPVFYRKDFNMFFIDISGFMGNGSPYYKDVAKYLQLSMNPVNIVPKVSWELTQNFVPFNVEKQKFLDKMIYYGKRLTLQDAFLPNTPDYLKINYTEHQLKWAETYKTNIWNYFVENNLVFSDDPQLDDRFLSIGPFSKFYTEIDNESSPQIGVWTGWQICRKFFKEEPKTSLKDFLKMDANQIFNDADYKPTK